MDGQPDDDSRGRENEWQRISSSDKPQPVAKRVHLVWVQERIDFETEEQHPRHSEPDEPQPVHPHCYPFFAFINVNVWW